MRQQHRPSVGLAVALFCGATSSLAQHPPRMEGLRPLSGGWSAADIIGARVRSADGVDVGEIEDLIVASDDRVVTAVVSVGGVLDFADKLVAVPYGELRVGSDNETFAIPLTNAQITAAPPYTGHPSAAGSFVDPGRAGPPDAATRREANEDAARAFAGDDPRVAEGIAESKKAYEDEEAKPQP